MKFGQVVKKKSLEHRTSNTLKCRVFLAQLTEHAQFLKTTRQQLRAHTAQKLYEQRINEVEHSTLVLSTT